MDDINPVPPQIPPQLAQAHTAPPEPHGGRPEEREPIRGAIEAVEAILRQPRRVMYQVGAPKPGNLILRMLFVTVFCSIIYGVVVGTFSQGVQLWAAPAKVAGGLLLSALICLPSLYIFTCLSGSQARLAEICGLMAGLLLLMTILLIGFAPVAWLFSQSTESVTWMGALHLVFWFVATGFGVRFFNEAFAHSQARSRAGFNTWVVIFLLVAVQMTTALRPIVGTAATFLPEQKKFFVAHWADCLRLPSDRSSSANR
jgi:hypothetical protein